MFSAVLFDYFNTCTTAVVRGDGHRRTARAAGRRPDAWLAAAGPDLRRPRRGTYGSRLAGLRRRSASKLGVEPSPRACAMAAELRVELAPGRRAPAARGRSRRCAAARPRRAHRRRQRLLVRAARGAAAHAARPPVRRRRLLLASRHGQAAPGHVPHRLRRARRPPRGCLYVGDGGSHELTGARRLRPDRRPAGRAPTSAATSRSTPTPTGTAPRITTSTNSPTWSPAACRCPRRVGAPMLDW